MCVQEGETVFTIEAGEMAIKRRDEWHTFRNPGPEPLRLLEIIAPGAFADYFEETAELLPDGNDVDRETRRRLEALHDSWGFEVDPDSVPELLERHGLET